jgi:hypothetical protein
LLKHPIMFYYCDGAINKPWCITRLRAHERVGNIHVLYRRNIVGGTLAELKWSSPMSHLWALSYPMCSITVYWPNYFVSNGLSSLMLQAYMTPKSKHHGRIPIWLHYWLTSWLYLPTLYLSTLYFFMVKPCLLAQLLTIHG